MLWFRLSVLFALICQLYGAPFLFNAPQTLTSFVSSASAASSGPEGHIADLRKTQSLKLQDSLDDDDFFKEAEDELQRQNSAEEVNTEAPPSLFRRKVNTILQKYRFWTRLTNSVTTPNRDEFQKAQDDFDEEYEKDFGDESLNEAPGYFYDKPIVKSAKQVNDDGFKPGTIGVFFMELLGSLVGLVYGAAAQLNYPGTTAAP